MTKETLEEQFLQWLKTCPVEVTLVQDNSPDGYVGYAVDFELNPNPSKKNIAVPPLPQQPIEEPMN